MLQGCSVPFSALPLLPSSCPLPKRRWRANKAKKQLAAQSLNALSLFVSALQKANDQRTVYNVVLILKEILSVKSGRSEQARLLISLNIVELLLPHFVTVSSDAAASDDFVSALYYVLAVVCRKAENNLRESCHSYGVVPLTLSAIRKYTSKPKVLNSILLFVKYLSAKLPTSIQLVRNGLISLLHTLLGQGKFSLNLTTLYVLETLSVLTFSKNAVFYILQHGGLLTILKLLDPNSWLPTCSGRKGQRSCRIFKAILQTLLHVGFTRGGRQTLKDSNSARLLLCWVKALPARDVWNRHIVLVSLIIQRCLPPLPLPVSSVSSPLKFSLPEKIGIAFSKHKQNCDENDNENSSSDDEDTLSCSTSSSEEDFASVHDVSFQTAEELQAYKEFFPELSMKTVHQADLREYIKTSPLEPDHVISLEERQALLRSSRENKRADLFLKDFSFAKMYTEVAKATEHLCHWPDLPHPDLTDARGCAAQEPLYKQPPKLIRSKVFQYLEERLATAQPDQTVVFDLDALQLDSEENLSQRFDCKSNGMLQFESRFESGNLRKVLWVGGHEYNLILSPDINTDCHHQWFYFRVSAMKSGIPYTFNIINCEKSGSSFNMGMKPLLYSVKENALSQCQWVRTSTNVCYFRNHYVRGDSVASILKDKPYYTASFVVVFPHPLDNCYLAYFYPYSYSLLQTHLYRWQHSHDTSLIYFHNAELCRTLLGNSVPVLTITAQPPNGDRSYIFLTSRVHPGESNSSWITKGVIDFLLSNKQSAQRLREKFIFKVVPMLNPDGVISGCHRCSMSGQDLNRQWISPMPSLFPTIFHTKSLLGYLHVVIQKDPLLFCDFHGHSRKNNVFLYGCSSSDSWLDEDVSKSDNSCYQVLPRILSELAPAFSYGNCCFAVEQNKESTARITVWRQFGISLSYTMECSYGGCDEGIYTGNHLNTIHLEEMGSKLCQAIGKLEKRLQDSVSAVPSTSSSR